MFQKVHIICIPPLTKTNAVTISKKKSNAVREYKVLTKYTCHETSFNGFFFGFHHLTIVITLRPVHELTTKFLMKQLPWPRRNCPFHHIMTAQVQVHTLSIINIYVFFFFAEYINIYAYIYMAYILFVKENKY